MPASDYLPRVSIFDPAEASEGSIDPLGLAQLATTLADGFVPAFTERSRRPRFLTAVVFGARLLGRPAYLGGPYGDHPQGPANIAFERLLVESYAQCGEQGDPGLLGVPGIGKARESARRGARLTSQLYLVAPGAVGLWAAYKRLARELRLIDDNGHLLEAGYELLQAWEKGIGHPGLVTSDADASRNLLGDLDRALEALIGVESKSQRPRKAWDFLHSHLEPHRMTRPEAAVIRRLVVAGDERRRDVFESIEKHGGGSDEWSDWSEDRVLRLLRAHGNAGTRAQVQAILAYEQVVVLLLAAFEAMRLAGKARPDGRIDAESVLANVDAAMHLQTAPAALLTALRHAVERIDQLGLPSERQATLNWLDDAALQSPHSLFDALLARHFEAQRRKPPDGKRPWIEGGESGYFVRTRYVPDAPPVVRATFHPYRTVPVRSMLRDLQDAEK